MFPEEQMCSKLCVIITFSCHFLLNCFQVQSCSSPWDLSNNGLQEKNEMKLRLLKDLKHMFPQGIWTFLQGKFIVLQGTIMSPGKRSLNYPREQFKLFFPWGIIMSSGRKSITCLGEQPCAQGSKGLSCMGGITMFLGNKCVCIFVWSKLFHMNSNSIASNYKVEAFLETFPMLSCKTIYKQKWDDYDF